MRWVGAYRQQTRGQPVWSEDAPPSCLGARQLALRACWLLLCRMASAVSCSSAAGSQIKHLLQAAPPCWCRLRSPAELDGWLRLQCSEQDSRCCTAVRETGSTPSILLPGWHSAAGSTHRYRPSACRAPAATALACSCHHCCWRCWRWHVCEPHAGINTAQAACWLQGRHVLHRLLHCRYVLAAAACSGCALPTQAGTKPATDGLFMRASPAPALLLLQPPPTSHPAHPPHSSALEPGTLPTLLLPLPLQLLHPQPTHLLHNLLLLHQEGAHDALLDHARRQVAAVGAVHRLLALVDAVQAAGAHRGQLRGRGRRYGGKGQLSQSADGPVRAWAAGQADRCQSPADWQRQNLLRLLLARPLLHHTLSAPSSGYNLELLQATAAATTLQHCRRLCRWLHRPLSAAAQRRQGPISCGAAPIAPTTPQPHCYPA